VPDPRETRRNSRQIPSWPATPALERGTVRPAAARSVALPSPGARLVGHRMQREQRCTDPPIVPLRQIDERQICGTASTPGTEPPRSSSHAAHSWPPPSLRPTSHSRRRVATHSIRRRERSIRTPPSHRAAHWLSRTHRGPGKQVVGERATTGCPATSRRASPARPTHRYSGHLRRSRPSATQSVKYEIDLSKKNRDKMVKALKPYTSAARRVGGRRSATGRPTARGPTTTSSRRPASRPQRTPGRRRRPRTHRRHSPRRLPRRQLGGPPLPNTTQPCSGPRAEGVTASRHARHVRSAQAYCEAAPGAGACCPPIDLADQHKGKAAARDPLLRGRRRHRLVSGNAVRWPVPGQTPAKNTEGFGLVGTAHDETGKGYNTNCHANVETP
jgi:hypothetical protein